MPATTLTRQWDALLTLTLDNYRQTLVDNIHKAIPLLYWLRDRARGQGIRYENGGALIQVPVVYQKNSNAGSYSKYDRLNIAPTDEITSTFEEWSELATTVAISRREMRQNSGKHAKGNLLRGKVDTAELGLKELVETQLVQGTPNVGATGLFGPGNSSKDMIPLSKLIAKQAVAGQKIHNIDPAVETWWQNRSSLSTTDATATFVQMRKEMATLFNNCSKGATNDGPDLILPDQNYFEAYENGLVPNQRYGNYGDDGAASVGFESLKYKSGVMIWSEFVPSFGTNASNAVTITQSAGDAVAYFINSRWLELVIDEESDFVTTPFEEPVDQTAVYAKILFMGQLTTTQRRKLGVHYNVNASALT